MSPQSRFRVTPMQRLATGSRTATLSRDHPEDVLYWEHKLSQAQLKKDEQHPLSDGGLWIG